jgi:class 3 adenylate cyclase/tetratricopeptide (TPR) repeat protein
MSGLGAWLINNGLGHLEGQFAPHDIDLDILDQLTDADLKELGLSIGLRKAFFKAVASDPPNASAAAAQNLSKATARSIEATPEAERRQLTVMFCDLVDSTRLSTLLDPETLSEMLRAYRGFCTQCAERFGGKVAKFMGDGILIYFGYPLAHEDDAERAVRAGLAIVRDLPRLRSHPDAPLHVRVGIATGLVVVGELIDTDLSQEHTVVGQTPNLSARLQALAPPDGIIVAPRTYQLTAGLFEFADMGEHVVKGFDLPIRVWQVNGESRAESRFDAHRGDRMAPIVGRRDEIGLLVDRWQATERGEGQVVLISGEPGVGKSRLTRALRAEINSEHYVCLSYHCSVHHQTTALYPIITQFERTAGFNRADTDSLKLAKLELLLEKWNAPVAETLPLFASLLSLPVSGRYEQHGLSPAEVIERTLQAMISRLKELADDRPVLCIVEDVQWIDPTSQELIKRLVAPVKRSPILVILTARTEYPRSALGEVGDITWLSLNRLTRHQAFAMIEQCVADRTLPPAVLEEIVSKADGIPLFVEELTKSVLESGIELPDEDRTAPVMLDVPATLHDSLMARLDQMSTTKQVAQMASVIGRTFTLDLLAAMTPAPAHELRAALERLVSSEVLYRADQAPVILYEFKHALLQDVAYQSLLKPARQRYHLRLARVLEEQFPTVAQSQPELLAHHFAEAGKPLAAIAYWLAAGKRATQRSANYEAIAQLRNGLALLENLSSLSDRLQKEHQLRLMMIAPLIAVKGYASTELEEACDRVVSLSKELGDTSAIFPVLSSRHAFASVTGHIDRARRYAEEAVSLATRHPQGDGSAFAGRLLGSSTFLNGDSASAQRMLEETLAKYDPDRDRGSAFVYGHDHFVTCASYLCLALWHQGNPTEALQYGQQALAHARSLTHINTQCLALAFTGGFFHNLCGMGEAAIGAAEELLALASEHRLPLWSATGTVIMGQALVQQGRERDGIAKMQVGIAGLEAIQIKLFRPMFLAWRAAAQLRCGEIGDGLAAVEEALKIGAGGEHWMDAELHRLRGELNLHSSPKSPADAEQNFRTALDIAFTQRSKTLALRAAMSLARLYGTADVVADAREVLAPALEWFNDARARAMWMTRDSNPSRNR